MSESAGKPFRLPLVYPITDSRMTRLSHTEQVRRLIDGGARLIQLREKYAASCDFYADAVEATSYAHSKGALIIINDRVDIALAVGADGVHLGQADLLPSEARKILGSEAIIGYSAHSVEQALCALQLPVDYVAIGPVFSTSTKDKADPEVGIAGVRAVRSVLGRRPLVAIGGINVTNADAILEAGADSVAVISEILSKPDLITETYGDMTNNLLQR